MHKIIADESGAIRVEVSGKLTEEDYEALIPSWEATIARHGSLRMLVVMEDFHGWETGAAWDDLRFATRHSHQVARIGMVGEKPWQRWMAKLGAFFLTDAVKYFDHSEMAEAERWVREG